MSNSNKIFHEATMRLLGNERGAQARLAREAGIHPPYLNRLLKTGRGGTDETRRKIAAALGYAGRRYEDFLDVGRRALGLPVIGKQEIPPEPDIAVYLKKARVVLESIDADLLKRLLNKFVP